ncbi:MAG: type II toxin-antitoxin system HicB family antitoxin [Chitinophagaceae bacterium]|nr:type II toxin-antitoxin system HicB family antitoxin [Chitinophagaceae bacterium]
MEKYLVVLEKSSRGFSAFSPDAPGCITVGETVESTIEHMREVTKIYTEEMGESGKELPRGKGVEYHIREGLLNEGSIANEYFLTQIEIELPEMA